MDAKVIAAAFATSAGYVFLKALQQLNIQARNWAWIAPVSLCMAAGELLIVTSQVSHGWPVVVPLGLGGASGAFVAIHFHQRFVQKT